MATILSINCDLDQELRNLGHTVYSVSLPTNGIFSAQEHMVQCPSPPDIFLHKELLGRHIFFSDAHTLPCTTVHWGIDSHLRYWWQMHYAALFDVFFTPHKAFLEHLPNEWQHAHKYRLTQPAPNHAFMPHASRSQNLNFVGRLTSARPQRDQLCKLLRERYKVSHKDGMSYKDMLNLYSDTRIIPNESIAHEVNFRLFEGSACGCALITPEVGEDQDSQLEPGHEILIYKNMDELSEHIDYCLAHPSFTEKMGRRAWLRIQKEHLHVHKAHYFMHVMEEFMANKCHLEVKPEYLPKRRQTPHNDALFHFMVGILSVHGSVTMNNRYEFTHKVQSIPSLALLLRIFFTLHDQEKQILPEQEAKERIFALLDEANALLMGNTCSATYKKMLAVAAGGAALRYNDAARGNFYLHLYEKIQFPEKRFSVRESLMGAKHTLDVALNWVVVLRRDQKQCFYGTDYVSGCCRTAFDFVSLCQELAPQDMRWFAAMSQLDHVIRRYPHYAQDMMQEIVTP